MNQPLVVAAVGVVVVVVAVGLNFVLWQEEVDNGPQAEQAARTTQSQAAATAGPPAAPGPLAAPTFDVVRIDPKGDAVMAGRAKPGSTVTIMDGDTVIGRVKADPRGEWVFVPDKPLEPGSRRLSLSMQAEGGEKIVSEADVVLVVPEKGKDIAGRASEHGQALVLKVPRGSPAPTVVMQRPTAGEIITGLFIDALDYDVDGRLGVSGRSAPATTVQLYLDNRFVGRAISDTAGVWMLSPAGRIDPGLYTLRVDAVDGAGKVVARASIPFSYAEPLAGKDTDGFVVVQPGNSLWRIAQRRYGSGFSYTTIFETNKEQIADPDLIFPGQVFALPSMSGQAGG